MKKNILLKVMFLLFGLVMVLWFRQQLGEKSFKEAVSSFFGASQNTTAFNWCADHVVDFVWIEKNLPPEILEQSMSDWREDFCKVKTESIENVDLDQVIWQPLAETSGATGQKAQLLWNRELGLFKAGGLPFKSSKWAKILAP